ncbi:TIM barrel protein [Luteipulveratus halotolerans]|uniref:Xylose isomerase-like TIM barrel domain-containing protein n=1 Tax=Luteipulveratus halotolerans TaxID=1631356 RepID=A0A0L6CJB4_9MICO|nr:TIM barrel protein [Luteipulveratus halotolerans]KNX37824.1 hypothetical protein VV01_12760 [Luteipulveratus halotolerans]
MTGLLDRVAAAPISWGVSEVEGWGVQLPVDQVLGAIREVGLTATELGPTGFLDADPRAQLDRFGLRAVAQFLPVVIHDETHDPRAEFDRTATALSVSGGTTVVLAASTGQQGYDDRPAWTEPAWERALGLLDDLVARGRDAGLDVVLHPHVGTMIESDAEVRRVLDGSAAPLCLDTGHLLIGGSDPVRLAEQHAARIAHVHLKDVRQDLLDRVVDGSLAYGEAVEQGIYVPLGEGAVDIGRIVESLEQQGYSGWYALEQDRVMADDDAAPATADVRASRGWLAAGERGARP